MVRLFFDVDWFFLCLLFVFCLLHICFISLSLSFLLHSLLSMCSLILSVLNVSRLWGGLAGRGKWVMSGPEIPIFFVKASEALLLFICVIFTVLLASSLLFLPEGGKRGKPQRGVTQRASPRGSSRFPFWFPWQGAFVFFPLDRENKSSLGIA